MELADGSRVAIVGGGPAGSLTGYFLLDLANRVGVDVTVDIYESRDFSRPAPHGCNMCGGIISESLVQMLATEGISLPPTVVQRGIDSYVLHSDVGDVRIETPLHEMRIAAVYRGTGPKGTESTPWRSFDGFLLDLARDKGVNLIGGRVDDIAWDDGRPRVQVKSGSAATYDLLVGAVGVNSPALKLFEGLGFSYRPPKMTKTFITEIHLGLEQVNKYVGSSMHVFLLDISKLEFAALIPKGEHVTVCLLGHDIDKALVDHFINTSEVKSCLPPDWSWPEGQCQCSPKINIGEAAVPFTDRVVLVGDCGVSRLYKDGMGAAYRTAKACAVTAIFQGVSAEDFRKHFRPTYRKLARDNIFGHVVFFIVAFIRKLRFFRRGVLEMARREQRRGGSQRKMSMVIWDTFTGSAPYRDVFWRAMRPTFLLRLAGNTARGFVSSPAESPSNVQSSP